MISDRRALEEEFIPQEVFHRDTEIGLISELLGPVTDGDTGIDMLLYGPPGTGKTCISQYFLERFKEENPEIRYQYINCWENYTRFNILYEALRGIGNTLNVHRQSTPTEKLYTTLKNSVTDRPYIIILDEFDQISEEEALYDLYSLPNTTLILIANRATALHSLEDRIRSRLMGCERLEFDSYSVDQLVDILEKRAKVGLEEKVEKGILRKIALSAEGDARIAISILRKSAIKAETEGTSITRDIVNSSVPDAKKEERKKDLEKLNQHQKVLHRIIKEEGRIKPGELYSRYREEVEEPKTERSLRKYLNKMAHYNLIETEGEGRWREYVAK